MSTKDLFNRNYLTAKTDKDAFSEVESSRNVKAVRTKQESFLPQVDYSDPQAFAKFGSARLYYNSAINRVIDFYPYDGSNAELTEFYNKSLDIEKYIFNYRYPRTNGYINVSADGWGTATARNGGYGSPSTNEYITFKGGPNSLNESKPLSEIVPNPENSKFQYGNIYDENMYTDAGLPSDYGKGSRTSNLKSDFDEGVTVEFWAKTGSLSTSLTEKQVVADFWNNALTSSGDYGRITIELDGTAGASTPWLVTVGSGSTSVYQRSLGSNLTIDSLSDWKHYAFVLQNSGSNFEIELYVDGQHNDTETVTSTTVGELNPENMMGRLGALLTAPSGSADATEITNYSGAGKLSGSLDEFRFWKTARNAKQIGQYWFSQVRGGVNSDIANTTLGMYYKFNEGISTDSAIDSVVLDYGGRICNGTWTGYGANSRNTGSAIVSASAASSEYLDPIIYSTHPSVASLKSELLDLGIYHDSQNNAMFLKNAPAWVIEEVEGNVDNQEEISNLDKLTHIMGAYFDKLYLQIQAIPKIRHATYTSASHDPFPFSQHLPQSLGLYTPELFIDANVLEKISNRTNTELFSDDLTQTKNLIYQNIYNNLAHIFKSKGTERSIRNVLRCFNIDDNLIYVNTYANNQLFHIENNLKQTQKKRKLLNLNKGTSTTAVVYQNTDPSITDSRGYLSGSEALGYEDNYGFTAEVGVKFPKFFRMLDTINRDSINTVSLYGMHSASVDNENETTIFASDNANFQVHAVRDSVYSKNVYFKLSSSITPFPIPEITTSLFYDVYDDESWNLSVALKPSKYPYANISSGSEDHAYEVVFRGYNNKLGTINNSFELSSSVTKTAGVNFLRAAKRLYVGATNENITGSTNTLRSDVLYEDARYWTKYLDSYTLKQHSVDRENFGISGSYRNIDAVSVPVSNQNSYNFNSLALNWYFQNVTSSDASGEFYVTDLSSGSALIRDNFGWAGQLAGYSHTARGKRFSANDTEVTINKIVNEYKFIDPERVISSEMVQVLSEDDELKGTFEQIPNYVFVIEKSLYAAVTEEILDFFAGSIDFNNLIGDPVNRYRKEYKSLNYLRSIYFERVENVSTVEKYVDYYKWFDDTIAHIIAQLVPASAEFVNDVYNTIESHVLERNKYQSRFPTLEFNQKDPEASIRGVVEAKLRYEADLFGGVAARPAGATDAGRRDTDTHVDFWKKRALPGARGIADFEITSSSPVLDTKRRQIRSVKWSRPEFSASMPQLTEVDGTRYTLNRLLETQKAGLVDFENPENVIINHVVKGGVNFDDNKDIHYTYTSLYPAGPVYAPDGGVFIPQNVLFAETKDLNSVVSKAAFDQEEPNNVEKKRKRHLKVVQGRDFTDGLGYTATKNSFAFPFNVMSASVVGGVDKYVKERTEQNLIITNLHNDVYGNELEIPMQGPFTNYAVGGHQSRHIGLNVSSSIPEANFNGLDNYLTRPEAWKLLLGKRDPSDPSCDGTSAPGAIGMTSPDYPWPEANDVGVTAYPLTGAQKAVYYRGFIAKRPVNIRNIQMRTGSTILGNYEKNYEVVMTNGAWENPRNFIETQPALPPPMFENRANSATQARTYLDVRRTSGSHYQGVPDYDAGYLTGTLNETIILSRFDAVGGMLTSGRGYRDFRSDEFSVYNDLDYKNISVIRPSQVSTGIISEPVGVGTPGIRIFDIHGKDFGLRAHASRHTARFGRDSNEVTNPGASYDQLPGYHKVHRNNIDCPRIVNETLQPIYTTLSLDNTQGISLTSSNADSTFVATGSHDAATGRPLTKVPLLLNALSGGSGNGFSWTGYAKFHRFLGPSGTAFEEPIFTIGCVNSSTEFAKLEKVHAGSGVRPQIHFSVATTGGGGSSRIKFEWHFPFADYDLSGTFNHYALVWNSLDDGDVNTDFGSAATLYFNGVSQSAASITSIRPDYRKATGTKTSYRNFSNFTAFGPSYMNIGGGIGNGTEPLSASLDEFTFWTKAITGSDVTEIYNGGTPCDITASALYADSASSMWDWIRFENSPDANRMVLDASNPGLFNTSTNSLIGFNANTFTPMALSTTPLGMGPDTSVPAGCSPQFIRFDEIKTYATQSTYDNLFLHHQIIRMSKQYSWLTSSLVSDNGICGFYNPSFTRRISSSAGINYVNSFDFVSASQAGSFFASVRRFPGEATSAQFIPQTYRINTNIREPISASSNVLGYPDSIPLADSTEANTQYLNIPFIQTVGNPNASSAPAFNNLMFKRGNQYGYPSWKQVRQQDHPILTNERLNNKLTIFTTSSQLSEYDLRPVSMIGRPSYVNLDFINSGLVVSGGSVQTVEKRENATLKTSYSNEYVLFNDKNLNNFINIDFNNQITPFEQLVALKDQDNIELNWVLYKENVFPSNRNEFASSSTTRINYDSRFWRDNPAQRVSEGVGIPNSFGVVDRLSTGVGPLVLLTQSIWPLDAPLDFETRTGPSLIGPSFASLITSNSAGELQNTYSSYTIQNPSSVYSFSVAIANLRNSALYSRKQMLASPLSLANPAGIDMYVNPFYINAEAQFDPNASGIAIVPSGSGEAKWEADRLAGYLTTSNGVVNFVSAASEPFYDNYDDFRADIKTLAKGYSIVPEFRISDQVSDYTKFGILGGENFDTFSIPGTTISSSQDNFYKDYSNSDFLEHFLDVRQMSNLTAKEIKLTCKAAVKFHPYKGFYPAQRTLDLVSQFSKSYGGAIQTFSGDTDLGQLFSNAGRNPNTYALSARPVTAPLFAPGILFNSIKSGLAVDYPIVTDGTRINSTRTSASAADPRSANFLIGANVREFLGADSERLNYASGAFWDKRIPFEAIMDPSSHMRGLQLVQSEPHPSMSFNDYPVTASLSGQPADNLYTLMASNFFAEVGKFFLDNGEYTKLQSNGLSLSDFKFTNGEVFGARLRIKTSYSGSRNYGFESGSNGNNDYYGPDGARNTEILFGSAYPTDGSAGLGYPTYDPSGLTNSGTFEIPQDPAQNPNFRKNFTMYSRTTAFGPPCIGRLYYSSGSLATLPSWQYMTNRFALSASNYGAKDSLNGFNWSFTPPYYDGEAWVDFIFRPSASVDYDLARILKETQTVTRRYDPGDSLWRDAAGNSGVTGMRTLVTTKQPVNLSGFVNNRIKGLNIYSGDVIDDNAMQINSSINLFGVENVAKKRFDKFGQLVTDENEIVAQKWVIQPKFETPMMNFDVSGSRPISAEAGTLTLPQNFGSSSVPRGMWHQFGTVSEDPNKGVFLEIGDIPEQWLKNHYDVIGSSSVYNDFNGAEGTQMHEKFQSFADLMGFTNENSNVRLGELANRQTIKEAVVAVPYILDGLTLGESQPSGTDAQGRKKFITIPNYRYEAALAGASDSAPGNSLDAAGQSIRRQVNKMEQYVLPPQFDFLNNDLIDPIVMYMFEFKYEFDRDDLSYMWQNLAPRNSHRMSLPEDSVAHELINTELLTEANLLENPNLRWMVFKVKQRSQAMYEDVVAKQVSQPVKAPEIAGAVLQGTQKYKVRYNWPYDFVSIVESIQLDSDVLYKNREPAASGSYDFIKNPDPNPGAPVGRTNETLEKSKRRQRYLEVTKKRPTDEPITAANSGPGPDFDLDRTR